MGYQPKTVKTLSENTCNMRHENTTRIKTIQQEYCFIEYILVVKIPFLLIAQKTFFLNFESLKQHKTCK